MKDKSNLKTSERSDISVEYYVSEIIKKDCDVFNLANNTLCNIVCHHFDSDKDVRQKYNNLIAKGKEKGEFKGIVLKFKLTQINNNILYTDVDYLRFLLMQYINNPVHVREKIIFKKKFELIEKAIKENKKLIVNKLWDNFIIEPYFVSIAKNETANYLFAYRYHKNEDFSTYYIYRISNLEIIDLIDEPQEFKDKNIIKEAKRDFHPWKSFLWEEIKVKVKFRNESGKQILKTYTNNCPKYKLIDFDEDIYEFTATEEQLKAYLLPIFNKIIIIEPYELRRWMWDELNDVIDDYRY